MKQRMRRRSGALLSVAAMSVMSIASLGIGASGSGAATSRGTSNGENVAYAKARVARYSKVPTWKAPGPAVNVASLKGQLIFDVPGLSTDEYVQQDILAEKAIAEKAGIKFVEYPTTGPVSQEVAGIREAISQKANMLFLDQGVDISAVQTEVKAAIKAGIKVVYAHALDTSQSCPTNVNACEFVQFQLGHKLMVDAAVAAADGKPITGLFLTDNELPSEVLLTKAFDSEFAKVCGPKCKLYTITSPAATWATQLSTSVASELAAHPSINWVFPEFDSVGLLAMGGVRSAGRASTIKISTFNGSLAALQAVYSGPNFVSDVAEDPIYLAYATMDQVFRVMTAMKPIAHLSGPLRIFNASDIGQVGKPPKAYGGFGTAFQTGYLKLWGLG